MSKPWSPAQVASCIHNWVLDRCLRCHHTRGPESNPPNGAALRHLTAGELGLPDEPTRIPVQHVDTAAVVIAAIGTIESDWSTPADDDTDPDPIDTIRKAMWTDAGDEDDARLDVGLIAVRCMAGHVTHPFRRHWMWDKRCYRIVYKPHRRFCFGPTVPLDGGAA